MRIPLSVDFGALLGVRAGCVTLPPKKGVDTVVRTAHPFLRTGMGPFSGVDRWVYATGSDGETTRFIGVRNESNGVHRCGARNGPPPPPVQIASARKPHEDGRAGAGGERAFVAIYENVTGRKPPNIQKSDGASTIYIYAH